MAAGTFVRPLKLSPNGRAIGFLSSEVDEFIAARVAERDAPKAKDSKAKRGRRA